LSLSNNATYLGKETCSRGNHTSVCAIGVSLAQKLTQLVHPAPDGAFVEYLLTDGTVMVQGQGCTDWWRLTPDQSGSYVKGTWKQAASLPSNYAPDAASGAVLADGRFLLVGGEYNNCGGDFTLTNHVLPNGMFLLGRKTNKNMAVLDPATLK
jgi:hypothetical protein